MTRQSEIMLYHWCKAFSAMYKDWMLTNDISLSCQLCQLEKRIIEVTDHITELIETKRHQIEPLDSLTKNLQS